MKSPVVWMCGVLLASWAWTAAGQAQAPRDVIAVEGYARATLEPDYAEWTVQIVTRDKAPKIALEVNDAVLQSLLKIAKSADIDETDIAKGRAAVEQEFRDAQNDDADFGPYEATRVERRVTLVMRELKEFEDALIAIHQLGVVYSVRYKSSAYENTVAKVKREALLDAKRQAEEQANAIGQDVGPAVRVDVVQGYPGVGGGLFGEEDWREDVDPEAAGPDGKVRIEAYADAEFKLEP